MGTGLRLLLFILLTALLGAPGGRALAQAPHTHQHAFQGAEHWARVFDDPRRDEWQKPQEVIAALDLGPRAVVADIGAGTGYFAVRLAQRLPGGKVYAVDIEPDMVKYLAARAEREGLKQLVAIRGSASEPRLPEAADVILFVDAYHHVDRRVDYLRELRKALKPGARIAVIDFRLDSPVGPPASGRIAPEQVTSEFERAGYRLEREHAFLPYQYFLVFRAAR